MIISFILFVLPIIALIDAIAYVPIAILINRKKGKQSFLWHLVRFALIGFCMSLAYLTLLWYYPDITFSPEWHFLNLKPFVWLSNTYIMGRDKMIGQLLLNIGMFVPYGFLLCAVLPKGKKSLLSITLTLGTTIFIETMQYFMGRSCDIDDVIMNFIGGLVGTLIFVVLQALLKNKLWWQNTVGLRQKETDDNNKTKISSGN